MPIDMSVLDVNPPTPHWIIRNDADYFKMNPDRQYRARRYYEGEFETDLFTYDENGQLGEVNFVVVKRIIGGRVRHPFNVAELVLRDDDKSISEFFNSRRPRRATDPKGVWK